jgi:Ser-tRNA(Ala) deacylase AlaX
MPISKEDIKALEALKAKAKELRTRVKRYTTLKTVKGEAFWSDFKAEQESAIKGYEQRRDDMLMSDEVAVDKGYAEARACARAIHAIKAGFSRVDNADNAIDRINEEIAEINNRISSIESKTGHETKTAKGVV